jgi:hypothetical protein
MCDFIWILLKFLFFTSLLKITLTTGSPKSNVLYIAKKKSGPTVGKLVYGDGFQAGTASFRSLNRIGTIDIKQDEDGILTVAHESGCTITFYTKDELNRVANVPTSSEIVKKHTEAKSVCEAAAILAGKMGFLVVPKQRTKNVTVAIARMGSML